MGKKSSLFVALILMLILVYLITRGPTVPFTVTLTPHRGNPILTGGDKPYNTSMSDPCVIFEDRVYKMWTSMGGLDNGVLGVRTGYYTSTDGITWVEGFDGPLPGLGPGEVGRWDHAGTDTVAVLHDEENYKLWYSSSTEVAQSDTLQIGYATSADGISWIRHPEPVLSKGSSSDWDGKWVESPCVIKENGVYRMWYSGVSNSGHFGIGLATSTDGVHWEKYAGNPVLSHGGSTDIDGLGVYAPSVAKIGNKYWTFYTTAETRTDYLQNLRLASAYSDDGIHWTKIPGAILEKGSSGSWDENGPYSPTTVTVGGDIKTYYSSGGEIGFGSCEISERKST